jgi:hypothetical protein
MTNVITKQWVLFVYLYSRLNYCTVNTKAREQDFRYSVHMHYGSIASPHPLIHTF